MLRPHQLLSLNIGIFSLGLGLYSGFVIRDEYNYPSSNKIDEMIRLYYTKDAGLLNEIDQLRAKLQEKKKQAAKEAMLTAAANSQQKIQAMIQKGAANQQNKSNEKEK